MSKRRTPALEGAEKVPPETKIVPQRLKPHYERSTCGTAEAVPLSKTDFFSTLSGAEAGGVMSSIFRLRNTAGTMDFHGENVRKN
jgi:hypothetical protein